MEALDINDKKHLEDLAVNEIALFRNTSQSSKISINDVIMKKE